MAELAFMIPNIRAITILKQARVNASPAASGLRVLGSMVFFSSIKESRFVIACVLGTIFFSSAQASDPLPIADAHIHYSHDSVEMTPPERVIELMRNANLKFALVSSSDDNGTQLLSELAPDLIVPGLRPYRRRGELGTWFTDKAALEYVENLLQKNVYATIGEFHLYGKDAELDIPRRIVELAETHNLILHAHSDADAVERLLAQSDTVKVIWAHSGFDSPEQISEMLTKHDRLWADLAFRSEVGSGGSLSKDWVQLFEDHPDRMMLGTDTYTPERMYFIPEHAAGARVWLDTLPAQLAENVAWKNAFDLIMPVWKKNKMSTKANTGTLSADSDCNEKTENTVVLQNEQFRVLLNTQNDLKVSEPATVVATVCGDVNQITGFKLDATMPAHGHGTNYEPSVEVIQRSHKSAEYKIEGIVLHMPGTWQWQVDITAKEGADALTQDFVLE